MRRRRIVTAAHAALVLALLAAAPRDAAAALDIPVAQYSLANGLRVVLSQRGGAPVVAVALYYDVGSRREEKGRSGFAHLFEHMMFQGSENVPKTAHFTIVSSHGGVFNGMTGEDYTVYFESLPSPMLAIALWLESDRMRSLEVTPENFENQRAVVIEERLQHYDNQPYAGSFIEVNRLAFEGYWPYAHPVIGERADLEKARFEWARDFHAAYYTPANAVLAIAGDFDTAEARALVEQYFGDIASPAAPPPFDPPALPAQAAERHKVLVDPLAPLPALHVCWHVPPMRTPDYYPLKLAALALGDGESSRLYRALVKEAQVVQELSVDVDGRQGPDLFSFFAVLTGAEPSAAVRGAVAAQLDDIAGNGLAPGELEKVKNKIRMKYLGNVDDSLSLAVMLGKYRLLWGDASLVGSEVDRFMAVTGEEVAAAVKKHLVAGKPTVLDVAVPSPGAIEGGLP